MFLHLVQDEKFIREAVELFNRCDPGNHKFVRISPAASKETRHIPSEGIRQVVFLSPEYSDLVTGLDRYTAVLIHGFFSTYHIDLTNKAPAAATLVWLFWGGELWTIARFRRQILLPLTRALYYKNQVLPWLKRNWGKYTALFRGRHADYTYMQKRPLSPDVRGSLEQAIRRVDYIVPVIEDDFHFVRDMFDSGAQMLEWNYPLPKPPIELLGRKVSGCNVLVGNSAHYSNNHVEIFRKIRSVKGFTGKIVVPLSYGDDLYRHDVQKFGSLIFGQRFKPLTEFMTYSSYVDLLCNCSSAFFNTRRQQGIGNIVILLYLGTRVFLREENPAYRFLLSKDITVFSIQKDFPCRPEDLARGLTNDLIEENRRNLGRIVDRDVLEAKTCAMVHRLKQDRRTL